MFKNTAIYKFFDQVKQEAGRITWASKRDVMVTTGVVLLSVLTISLICLFVDFCVFKIINFILNI